VYIYKGYREIKTGVSLFWTTLYVFITARCYAERGIAMASRLSVRDVEVP